MSLSFMDSYQINRKQGRILLLGPTFLVVTEDGVEGRFFDLKRAKETLNRIDKGAKYNRFIVEVDLNGKISDDPEKIDGEIQTKPDFDSYWCGDECINKLLIFCEKYWQHDKGLSKGYIVFVF